MNPSDPNPTGEPRPHPCHWVVLTHLELLELLAEAHAMMAPNRKTWVELVARKLREACSHATHDGAYLLLTDIPDEKGQLMAVSLRHSLDWTACSTLASLIARDTPAHWSEQWQVLVRSSLLEVLQRHHRPKIAEAATEAWSNYWAEVLRVEASSDDDPISPPL
jgi:hypothetical protein